MNRRLNIRQVAFNRGSLRHIREAALLLGVYFLYMFVRKFLISDIEVIGFSNAISVVTFELAGGFFWELSWQDWAISTAKELVIILNWVYIITYWPIIIATAIILYTKDRRRYYYYRSVWLLSFVFALLVFGLFPLAPPRFLPEYGFIDTIQRFGPSLYGGRDMAIFYNAFAAMPSLHFGWTILFGIFFLTTKYRWLKPFGIIYPAITFFAITVTGNHYIIDAVGGAAIILASFLAHHGILRVRVHSPALLSFWRNCLGRGFNYVHGTLLRWKVNTVLLLAAAKSLFRQERLPTRKWRTGFHNP